NENHTNIHLFKSQKPEHVPIQIISQDELLQEILNANPQTKKSRQIPTNNFIALIDGAVASPKPKEEKFSNTKIETDG
ncbi:hypothetical protein, partial [Pseudomonas syringae group genomosp. 7]|uniref:hypothetical protein n=1 Tax=Pseudomonas syringae group genomosp. 7 TaxID=251699 RepID=UPI00376FB4EE